MSAAKFITDYWIPRMPKTDISLHKEWAIEIVIVVVYAKQGPIETNEDNNP